MVLSPCSDERENSTAIVIAMIFSRNLVQIPAPVWEKTVKKGFLPQEGGSLVGGQGAGTREKLTGNSAVPPSASNRILA